MADPIPLDRAWLTANPLIVIPEDSDKNSRGRVLVVGGRRRSAGALRLTGEAAFRAGAGKVQLATLDRLADLLGMAVPEAGVIPLPEGDDGQLSAGAAGVLGPLVSPCDCLAIGPGMGETDAAAALVDHALEHLKASQALVLDAAALRAAGDRHAALAAARFRLVLTPHAGEMAALIRADEGEVRGDPLEALEKAVAATGQVVLVKGPTTYLAAPGAPPLAFAGGGPGLATGGSGDVLAGIVAALLSRGQDALTAAAWGVWLHGEAGRRLAERQAPVGYLARELIPLIPSLIRGFG